MDMTWLEYCFTLDGFTTRKVDLNHVNNMCMSIFFKTTKVSLKSTVMTHDEVTHLQDQEARQRIRSHAQLLDPDGVNSRSKLVMRRKPYDERNS